MLPMPIGLPQKVIDQIANAGLPTGGPHPFKPRIVRNRKGEQIIDKKVIRKGPKQGDRGYVDDQGRIWIKDRSHGRYPDHWDVQIDDGADYFRVGLDGNELVSREERPMSVTPQHRPTAEESIVPPLAEQQDGEYGLLANGSSRLWDVAIDESLEREGEWLLELNGRTNYLVFQIHKLSVIREAIDSLQRGLNTPEKSDQRLRVEAAPLTLGYFGTSAVWLMWDEESPLRCFLIVGPNARSTMRLTLHREDIEMLLEAMRQVAKGLPEEAK
jgi:hypothetical protein